MTSRKEKYVSYLSSAMLTASLLALLAFFILHAKTASGAVLSSLSVAVKRVIPSVFPSMVISGALVSTGGGDIIGRTLGKPIGKLLNASPSASAAIILGALCGFPVGAASASLMYQNGEIGKSEFESVIGIASIPSPAFVINAVGANILGNRNAGVFLYALMLVSTLFLGAIFLRSSKKEQAPQSVIKIKKQKAKLTEATVSSISASAVSSLKITAYIVFFSTLTATLSEIFIPQGAPDAVSVILGGILEFSGGCASAGELKSVLSLPLCALFLGFSGLGVHFQVISACPSETSFKKYFIISAFRGALAFLLTATVSPRFFGI